MQYTYRPIENFPRERTAWPVSSPFDTSWSDTLSLLDRELTKLGAWDVVVQLDLAEHQIRRDGMPRGDARPSSSAVVLTFESRHGSLQFATDRFRDWHDNVRAIALGLESLRRVDRYGITQNAEQYAGWKELSGGPTVVSVDELTKYEAFEIVRRLLKSNTSQDEIVQARQSNPDLWKRIVREARINCHPDANLTDVDAEAKFKRLEEALEVLKI